MSATGAEVKTGIICGMEILVVDDELAIRKGLRALLEASGYEVRTARDGAGALTAVRAKRPNLVLLDVMMPGTDGFSFLSTIREDHSLDHIRIIMVSAVSESEEVMRASSMGANDYLTKPINAKRLYTSIANQINQLKGDNK